MFHDKVRFPCRLPNYFAFLKVCSFVIVCIFSEKKFLLFMFVVQNIYRYTLKHNQLYNSSSHLFDGTIIFNKSIDPDIYRVFREAFFESSGLCFLVLFAFLWRVFSFYFDYKTIPSIYVSLFL